MDAVIIYPLFVFFMNISHIFQIYKWCLQAKLETYYLNQNNSTKIKIIVTLPWRHFLLHLGGTSCHCLDRTGLHRNPVFLQLNHL